jgi:Uma2 family endonuclease
MLDMTTMSRDLTSTEQYFDQEITPRHSQLVDGEMVVDVPTEGHRVVVSRVLQALNEWAGAVDGRGEATVGMNLLIDERNVFSPDIAYLGGDRVLPDGIQHIDGTPDLAVEVRSLSTWCFNVGPKLRSYERLGLPELWLVDSPVASILVFRRSDPQVSEFDVALEITRGELLTSPLLRRFELPVDDIFAPLRSRD